MILRCLAILRHSPANFIDIRASAKSFSAIAGYVPRNSNVAEPGHAPEQVYGMAVTPEFLTILGVRPALGRLFAPDEEQPGKGAVVILTDWYWRRHFNADPKIIGRTLRVGVDNLIVVGVLAPSIDRSLLWYECGFLQPFTCLAALCAAGRLWMGERMGRLKPGTSQVAAQAEMNTLPRRWTMTSRPIGRPWRNPPDRARILVHRRWQPPDLLAGRRPCRVQGF